MAADCMPYITGPDDDDFIPHLKQRSHRLSVFFISFRPHFSAPLMVAAKANWVASQRTNHCDQSERIPRRSDEMRRVNTKVR